MERNAPEDFACLHRPVQAGAAPPQTPPPALRLTLDLPCSRQYVCALRRTVSCLLESAGVPEADRGDIALLLGELAANAVLHAAAEGYRVEVEYRADRLLVVVSDRGRGFPAEPSLLPPGTARPAVPAGSGDVPGGEPEQRTGGWGLLLVSALSDRVEILPAVPHGAVVRAERLLGRHDA